jgi:sec-independent protein translocase protein TatC
MASEQNNEMPLLQHLGEMRARIFRSLLVTAVLAIICFSYTPLLLSIFSELFNNSFAVGSIIGTKPAEAFTLRIKLALLSGLILAAPYIFAELWLFLSPGLTRSEKKLMLPFIACSTALFCGGALFCYYAVLPVIYEFFASQYTLLELNPAIQVSEHIGMAVKLILCFAVMFELPVVSWLLARAGLLTYSFMVRTVRYAIVIIFIVAAVLTPPDVISQFLMAGPLLLLYFLSMLVVKLSSKPIDRSNEEDAHDF